MMLANFVPLLNRTIDEKFHSFQRANRMKKTKDFFPITHITVTFTLEFIGKLTLFDEIVNC